MQKLVFWSIVTIASGIGSWIPSWWHAGVLSISGLVGGAVGFIAGLWLAKLLDGYIAG
jgi:hypothetical protein